MSATKTILAVLLLLASCSSEVPEPIGKTKELAAASTAFAFKLHGEALRQSEGKNVFLSPASVMFALSMAASGAGGETREEMLAALELKGWKREDLDASCAALLRWLEGGIPGVRLDVANSAWLRQEFPFDSGYVKRLEDNYNARARAVDFKNPKTLESINDWVKDRTKGKIVKAGPAAIRPQDVLFLINAVYFKGEWREKFEKSLTRDQPFYLGNGKSKNLPFMQQTGRFRYADSRDFQAIRIPYGEKDRMSFYVVLPKEGISLNRVQDQLAALGLKWNAGFESATVHVEMPRFKLEVEVGLQPVLASMGMKKAFVPLEADFSGMSSKGRDLYISAVYHKTYVDVNEEGTEAAAVSTVAVGVTSAPPPPVLFRVDRPFFCAIADETTGTILFTGSIVDP
ncbi:MAG TPA: serpin family protein [Planctomycetota bacterium]|nr:serpin family protein [Planctomycetota bacterium]